MWEGVRTPYCFILSQVKFLISDEQVNHFDFNFARGVGKSAKLLVIAFQGFIGVDLAELGLVATRMIDLLNFVMGICALLIATVGVGAEFVTVLTVVWPPSVHSVMEVHASFSLMVL